MKYYSTAALSAFADGTAIDSAAIKIACTPPFRVWGGYGTLTIAGEEYVGIGDRGLVSSSGGSLGDSEQNITLSLSGIEPDVLTMFNATDIERAPCLIWRLVFDGSGTTLLDAKQEAAGRIDAVRVEETIGGTSTIFANVETAARGLGRSGARMRTDADQRLIDPNDEGFHKVSYAGNITLYWGGMRPTSASSLGWAPIPSATAYGGYDNYGF